MAHQLKNSALPHALADVVADVADLIHKELQLARAEFSAQQIKNLPLALADRADLQAPEDAGPTRSSS